MLVSRLLFFWENFQLFHGFNNLVELILDDNQINEYPSNLSQYLPKLTDIFLQDNKLKSPQQKDFIGYGNITMRLVLANNEITTLHPDVFKNAKQIYILNLNNNAITNISTSAFKSLLRLSYLKL